MKERYQTNADQFLIYGLVDGVTHRADPYSNYHYSLHVWRPGGPHKQ